MWSLFCKSAENDVCWESDQPKMWEITAQTMSSIDIKCWRFYCRVPVSQLLLSSNIFYSKESSAVMKNSKYLLIFKSVYFSLSLQYTVINIICPKVFNMITDISILVAVEQQFLIHFKWISHNLLLDMLKYIFSSFIAHYIEHAFLSEASVLRKWWGKFDVSSFIMAAQIVLLDKFHIRVYVHGKIQK